MTQTTTQTTEPSLPDLVDHLTRFDGPPEQFLLHLLAVQCHVCSAAAGSFMRTRKEGDPEVLAVYPAPKDKQPLPWMAHAAEHIARVASSKDTVVVALRSSDDVYEQTPREHLIMIPLRSGEGVRGVAVFVLALSDTVALDESRKRLELTISLLSLYEMRLTLQRRQIDMQRLRQALEVLASINDQTRFRAAAMGFCNEVSSVWDAERVTLGFHRGRYLKAVTMSHTEKLTRKMKIVLDIESAMEECFDQDVEIIHPPSSEAMYVSRATGNLAKRHGPTTVCSLPLRQGQKVLGVLVVERPPDKSFDTEAVESLRLVCELSTARLADLYEHDKWFGAKAAGAVRKGLATLVGPEYTWVKVAVAAIFAVALFFTFAKGTDYAEGPFTVEATEKRLVPAPYDGFLDLVKVEQGDPVFADVALDPAFAGGLDEGRVLQAMRETLNSNGIALSEQSDVSVEERQNRWIISDGGMAYVVSMEQDRLVLASLLATLDVEELREQLLQAQAEQFQAETERKAAAATFNTVAAQVADAQAEAAKAQARLLWFRISQAQIVAPLSGVVLKGDLKKEQGGNVEQGNVLFEIAPKQLRAQVSIPEARIVDLAQESDEPLAGELTAVSQPGLHLPVVVKRISPIAETTDDGNVYRVRVELVESEELDRARLWLTPGLEGVARIEVGRAHFAWLWTRDLIHWVRMKLWW